MLSNPHLPQVQTSLETPSKKSSMTLTGHFQYSSPDISDIPNSPDSLNSFGTFEPFWQPEDNSTFVVLSEHPYYTDMQDPLPDHALTLHGGCQCRAIRYTIDVPELSERPIWTSASDSAGQGDIRYPLMLICHCNDCRHSSGNTSNPAMMCPMDFMKFSFLLKDPATSHLDGSDERRGRRIEVNAMQATVDSEILVRMTYFTYYQSPKKKPVKRMFCGRCGTGGFYVYMPDTAPLPGWIPSMDLLLGTLDREDLERVRVDRHVWWDYGVEWVQRWQTEGDHTILTKETGDLLPRHPTVRMGEFAEGYGRADAPNVQFTM